VKVKPLVGVGFFMDAIPERADHLFMDCANYAELFTLHLITATW